MESCYFFSESDFRSVLLAMALVCAVSGLAGCALYFEIVRPLYRRCVGRRREVRP